MTPAGVAALLACAALTAGCWPKTPDYQAIWTTSRTAASATATEAPVPVATYLEEHGVGVEQVVPDSLPDLTVSIPTPPGWSKRADPTLPPGTQVIGTGDRYPRAILAVFKLNGDVDASEVVKYGLADAELSRNFRRRYLVQLTIVTLADQAASQAAAVEAIMTGFTVAAK